MKNRVAPFFQRIIPLVIVMLLVMVSTSWAPMARADSECVTVGTWTSPQTGKRLAHAALISTLSTRPVVLLGETHDNPDHHRWQSQIISALHGRNPNLVLAFESFPRSVQPALDRWIRGEMTEKQFLDQSRWFDVWRYDPSLYMPLFHFARLNRIPMIAMNIERSLISAVGKDGWQAVPKDQREGLSDPAPPSNAYLDYLAGVYGRHNESKKTDDKEASDTSPALDDPAFRRFVEAQTVWDRAMAEKLAETRNAGGNPLVVGIVGWGHLQYGYGIPHQLAALGIKTPAVLLPWGPEKPCDFLKDKEGNPAADGVFGLPPQGKNETKKRATLGVMIARDEKDGIKVNHVIEGSIAQRAGLKKDDTITVAAGTPVLNPAELVSIIQSQPPGTWLPLTVRRDGSHLELIAKFPAR